MSSWVDVKYINQVSVKLERFSRKSDSLYNFRCCFCGDSKRSKTKARAYFHTRDGQWFFHCHNGCASRRFSTFLKDFDPVSYGEYSLDLLRDKREALPKIATVEYAPPRFDDMGCLKRLKRVSVLESTSKTLHFVESRKIPKKYWTKLYECPNFMGFTNSLLPGKFSDRALSLDETRLLIPLLSEEGKLFGFQGRALLSTHGSIKYITTMLDGESTSIYGLDTVDRDKTIYVFEGPIDSMFVENSIATLGGDLASSCRSFPRTNLVIVYDNEPRSADTVRKISKAIDFGYSVAIWPEYLHAYKDVNDMFLADESTNFQFILKENTFNGLSARMRLADWRKI